LISSILWKYIATLLNNYEQWIHFQELEKEVVILRQDAKAAERLDKNAIKLEVETLRSKTNELESFLQQARVDLFDKEAMTEELNELRRQKNDMEAARRQAQGISREYERLCEHVSKLENKLSHEDAKKK